MLIALLTDTHAGVRNNSPAFHDYFERFYSEIFFPYLEENNIDTIIHLGDFWDHRKYVNYYTLQRVKEYFFKPIQKKKIRTIVNVGNHDAYYNNTLQVNAVDLNLAEYSPLVEPVNSPKEFSFGKTKILIVPWICDSNYEQCMEAIRESKAQICFGHFELDGFEMHKGVYHVGECFNKDILGKFDLVASGHFHHRSTSGNINYLGCPYEMSWADYDDQKGFHVFDTETKKLKFIPNNLSMYEKLYYNDEGRTLDQIMSLDFAKYRGMHIKVVVKNKSNPYWYDKFLNALENEEPTQVQVVEDSYDFNIEQDYRNVNESASTIEILYKYIDEADLEIQKDELKVLMKDIYEEALDLQ